jgi:hypothetical protein
MKMKKFSIFFLLILGIVMIGCRQESENPADEQNPLVTIVSPTSEDNMIAQPGSNFTVEGYAEDNEEVASLTYSVALESANGQGGQPWEVSGEPIPNANLGQRRVDFNFVINVPQNVQAGTYRVSVRADDPKGNYGVVHTDVYVTDENGTAPMTITIESPDQGQSFAQGENFIVTGNATDPAGVFELSLLIEPVEGTGWNYAYDFDGAQGQSYDFSHQVQVPEDAEPGQYQLIIRGVNNNGHTTTATRTISIREAGTAVGRVTFIVNVPENTPEDAPVYLTGNFEDDIPMNRQGDGTYSVTVEAPVGQEISYNYFRGAAGTEEVNEDGTERAVRTYTVEEGENEVTDTVERWADHDDLNA